MYTGTQLINIVFLNIINHSFNFLAGGFKIRKPRYIFVGKTVPPFSKPFAPYRPGNSSSFQLFPCNPEIQALLGKVEADLQQEWEQGSRGARKKGISAS